MPGFKHTFIGAMAALLALAPGAWAGGASPASPDVGAYRAQFDGPPGGDAFGGYGPPPGVYPGHGYERRTRGASHRGAMISYHGFRLDLAASADSPNVANAVASAEHQVDIVDRAGLSEGMLRLFRGLPVRVTSSGFGGGGHFRGGREVEIGVAPVSDQRPILLHEYMHAYHLFRLPGGFRNRDILHFYNEAVSSGLYEQGSYMLSNPAEFFAMTASCYLNGSLAREPYNRDEIRTRQPDYYAYLGRLFGRAGD